MKWRVHNEKKENEEQSMHQANIIASPLEEIMEIALADTLNILFKIVHCQMPEMV